jgi:hypothetical protein
MKLKSLRQPPHLVILSAFSASLSKKKNETAKAREPDLRIGFVTATSELRHQ